MNQIPEPPIARKLPTELTAHGDTRFDDYHWMRDRTNPETIRYLEAENAYTAAVMAHTRPLQEKLYAEILNRIQQTDMSVPAKRGGYFYYTRTETGKQYPIWCRRFGAVEAPEQVLLDGNELAKGHDFFALANFEVSEDGNLLAYAVDFNGSEQFTLRILRLDNGELVDREIPGTTYGLEWGNDNRTFYYVTFDETKRPEKVYRHVLGADPAHDTVVFHEPDTLFSFEIHKTRDRRFILITSANAGTTSEVLCLNADQSDGEARVMEPRQAGIEYYAEHQNGRFLIRTNADGAVRFKVVETPAASPARPNWREFLPERPGVTVTDVEPFRDFLVIGSREEGLPMLSVHNLLDQSVEYISFPEPAYSVSLSNNLEYETSHLRFDYTSLVTPHSIFDYDMATKTRELKKQMPVLGGYDPAQYTSERIRAIAPDRTPVAISLVYKRGLERNGSNPLLLQGYGSYGINSEPAFQIPVLSLLDRGFIFAEAHVRGGSEYGRQWFDDGRLLRKRNSFTDFIACAEYLIAEGYTAASRLCAHGGSAGGLLMGAVINMRPDLFHAAIARVPFVDVVTTMSDPTIPLTTGEYDQWGNPKEKLYYEYMKSYSPYDNVERKAYPNLLITTGLNDPRVAYWEPAKWTARLRAMKTDNNKLLLKTEMGAGHGGPSGRYERYRETAFLYAFLLDSVGISE